MTDKNTFLSTKEINFVFDALSTANHKPEIELNYTSNYTLLVAVMLSAQSTDKMVNKITSVLFSIANTPAKMCELGEDNLKLYIKSINYYNNKAKNIVAMSKILIEKYHGEVPESFDALVSLPGVGRKSANVILNTAHNHPTIAVDTHVFRVSNRLGLCKTCNPTATEIALHAIVPEKWKRYAHHWLVLHGRYICKAKKPLCGECILNSVCKYYNAHTNENIKL